MTLSLCDQVAERVALGESLGALSEHAAACASCQRLIAMVRRWPIRAARPVTPVRTSNSPSDSSSVHTVFFCGVTARL